MRQSTPSTGCNDNDAGNDAGCNDKHDKDKFGWSRYSNDVHQLCAIGEGVKEVIF